MLGFSIGKLLVLGAIIAFVWYGFKLIGRRNQRVSRPESPPGKLGRNPGRAAGEAPENVEDMDKCARCGTFVPVSAAKHCGREDCPYPA